MARKGNLMPEFGDEAQCKNCPEVITLACPPGLKAAWFHTRLDAHHALSFILSCPHPYHAPIAEPVEEVGPK